MVLAMAWTMEFVAPSLEIVSHHALRVELVIHAHTVV